MSEELYGAEAVEHSQGFTPMEDTTPAEPSEIGSDVSSLREAADGLYAERESPNGEAPPDEVSYRDQRGELTDERQTIKLERGAKDLARYREQQRLAEEREEAELIKRHTDALRAGQQSPIDQAQAAQQQQPQPQYTPEQAQAQQNLNQAYQQSPYHGAEQVAAQMRQDPMYHQAIKGMQADAVNKLQALDNAIGTAWASGADANQIEGLNQQYRAIVAAKEQVDFLERAEMAIRAGYSPKIAATIADREVLAFMRTATDAQKVVYEDNLLSLQSNAEDIVNLSIQLFFHGFPELNHCHTAGQLDAAIAAVRNSNPARGQQIEGLMANIGRAVNQSLQVKERVENQKKQAFQVYQQNQANIFRSQNREFISPDVQRTIAMEAVEYLESKGLSRSEIVHLHETDPLFNHSATQSVLWDAMRYNRAKGYASKRQGPKPTHVMKPGSSETHIDRDRGERLPNEISDARAAAENVGAPVQSRAL